MTFRPRIRTLKPETWADEKIGSLSRDARLLWVGLVTMADDEGRLRALPAAIIGHCFPYDNDLTPAKVGRLLDEIERLRLIVRYRVGGHPYIALPGWMRHQRVNRPTPSELPPPPDTDVSVNSHGSVSDESVNDQGDNADRSLPRARACAGADRDQDLNPPTPLAQNTEFLDWLTDHERVTGHQAPGESTKARAALAESFNARRSEGYTLDDLKLATVGAHQDEYRRERGYDVAESILRPTKVASLIAKGKLRTRPAAGALSSRELAARINGPGAAA